ncbi:hypothetical protein FD755_000964, partial [Muntiacus reevesi]
RSSGAHSSEVQDSGFVPLKGIRGGSVLFHVIKKQEAEPEEVSWGFGPESSYRVLLQVHNGADTPTWVSLQDKYQHRVYVPYILSLKIENRTQEGSGHYQARASFQGGRDLTQSASITPDWCKATLECTASGDTEDLKVTWESKGLPRELEQRVAQGRPSNSWTLSVSLLLSQPSVSLTCVVRKPGAPPTWNAMPTQLYLGNSYSFLKSRCALLSLRGPPQSPTCGKKKNKEIGMWRQYLEEKEPFTNVFGEVHTQAMS